MKHCRAVQLRSPSHHCFVTESSPGVPERAGRAAAVAGRRHQAEGEGKSRVSKSSGSLGQRLQRAEQRHQQIAGGAAAEPGEDGGDGEDAEGSVRGKARNWEHLLGELGPICTYVHRLAEDLNFKSYSIKCTLCSCCTRCCRRTSFEISVVSCMPGGASFWRTALPRKG